ncbi:hypothetical protein F5X68DRAFT_215803 [Plectosphaerella plurivora]|uniref:Uncharacterized protein n=1 Tax=Plectosphaerella plurivora TaxID=936078 RepID=A0A9P8V3R9_9PEZI|nr:hypothetical protein F5X68DRAFT_215803 [Plectosphaerella plurivora]
MHIRSNGRMEEDGRTRGALHVEFPRERTKKRFIVFCQLKMLELHPGRTRDSMFKIMPLVNLERWWKNLGTPLQPGSENTTTTELGGGQSKANGQARGQSQAPTQGQAPAQNQAPNQNQVRGQSQARGQSQVPVQNKARNQNQPRGQSQVPAQKQTQVQVQTRAKSQVPTQNQARNQNQVRGQGQAHGQGQAQGERHKSPWKQQHEQEEEEMRLRAWEERGKITF